MFRVLTLAREYVSAIAQGIAENPGWNPWAAFWKPKCTPLRGTDTDVGRAVSGSTRRKVTAYIDDRQTSNQAIDPKTTENLTCGIGV